MRDVGRHSPLVDLVRLFPRSLHLQVAFTNAPVIQTTIRMLMSIGGLVPLPSDALVTPVTFRVRKRNLRGILAEFDDLEDESRELSGEWVVGKKLWQRLQSEWKDGHKGKADASARLKAESRERVVLYLHGGGFIL
jgi:hypothetical protein